MSSVQRLDHHGEPVRQAIYRLSLHGFLSFLQTGRVSQILDGLPVDAKVVSASIDCYRQEMLLVVESAEFFLTPPSCLLPQKFITVRTVVSLDGFDPPLPVTEREYFESVQDAPASLET